MPIDEDAPLDLLWAELRQSDLWKTMENGLLARRDNMVARMVVEEDCKPKRGTDGSIESEDAGVILARIQRKMGYIEAINAILDAPRREHEKAKTAQETA